VIGDHAFCLLLASFSILFGLADNLMFSLGGKIADTFGCCESIPCKLQISTFILTLFVKFKTKHIGFYFTFSCIILPGSHFYHGFLCKCDLFGFSLFIFDLL